MRLTKHEQNAIVSKSLSCFGDDTHVYLFGSRLDDTKRGGDVDLMISTKDSFSGHEKMRRKIQFLVDLKNEIGDQRIDVLIIKHGSTKYDDITTGKIELSRLE